MALFELTQNYTGAAAEWKRPTFKECAAVERDTTFFNEDEHAELHKVDGKEVLIILEESDLRIHSAHWEAGAKQNFDTGLYTAHETLYIRVEDYGPKPKIGKLLTLDGKRTYTIQKCVDEGGIYRMTIERTQQG